MTFPMPGEPITFCLPWVISTPKLPAAPAAWLPSLVSPSQLPSTRFWSPSMWMSPPKTELLELDE